MTIRGRSILTVTMSHSFGCHSERTAGNFGCSGLRCLASHDMTFSSLLIAVWHTGGSCFRGNDPEDGVHRSWREISVHSIEEVCYDSIAVSRFW